MPIGLRPIANVVLYALLRHTTDMDERGTNYRDEQFGKFRISTLLSWTAVAAVAIKVAAENPIRRPSDTAPALVFFAVLFSAATCIPFLVDRLLDSFRHKRRVRTFSTFWKTRLILCVGLYSMATFALSSIAFNAEWKGHKGPSWFYYTLESYAALTWWPSYLAGGFVFIRAIIDDKLRLESPLVFLMALILAAISWSYTVACIFMNFAGYAGDSFWIIPGSCAICYSLFAALTFRQRNWSLETIRVKWAALTTTLIAFVVGIVAKYPLTVAYYQQLADDPPEDCFIVSAASKGHHSIVGTWCDAESGKLVNQQLINFWQFENFLKETAPAFHLRLRKIYNRVGPVLAKLIVFKWQASLIYILLKPFELMARAMVAVKLKC